MPLKSWRRERAQSVIIFALFMSTASMFMALTIDVGLLVNERRDAQNDVDRSALAAALELTLDAEAAPADSAAALLAARAWARANGIDLDDPDVSLGVAVIDTCFSADDGVPTGVTVTLRRPAPSFLIGLLGIEDWSASATATACTGRPSGLSGFMPFAVSEVSACFSPDGSGFIPHFGDLCNIVVDANASGLVGELGLDRVADADCAAGNSSASVLENNITTGAVLVCAVGDSIIGNAGHNVGKTRAGIESRLTGEGACDSTLPGHGWSFADTTRLPTGLLRAGTNHDGVDDFFEVFYWQGDVNNEGMGRYADCSSPRDVSVIVVHDFAAADGDAGPKSYIVRAFAQLYIEGCTPANGTFDADCDFTGGGKFTIHARMVDVIVDYSAEIGISADFGQTVTFLRS